MIKKLIKHVREMDTEVRGKTVEEKLGRIPVLTNSLWSSNQREGHSLHEISYRACFKPQLPRFFIEHLSKRGHVVYDPFAGRGTTMVESLLAGRKAIFNDINPVCTAMAAGRVDIPTYEEVEEFLRKIPWRKVAHPAVDCGVEQKDLLAFFAPGTLSQIRVLRENLDYHVCPVSAWVAAVCLHLLTGHSDGYFSGMTFPPNMGITADRQRKLNEKHERIPPFKHIVPRILKKTKSLLKDVDRLGGYKSRDVRFFQSDAGNTPGIEDESVDLVITSPPFMDVVDYKAANWLKAWFLGVDIDKLRMKTSGKEKSWKNSMFPVFDELERVLKPEGVIAFEVGDIRKGSLPMEDLVIQAIQGTYLEAKAILINDHQFTKTSQCWKVNNNKSGTNTNRIVLIQKV